LSEYDLNDYGDYLQGGFGWSLYCLKDFDKSRKELPEASLITGTKWIKKQARWLYNKERKLLNDFIYYQLDS